MHVLLIARAFGGLTSTPALVHLLLFAALWGYAASWINQFIKQDGWPSAVNAVIANAVVIVSAAFATILNSPAQVFTLHAFWVALVAAFTAAVINHQFFLEPTGIGPRLKRATSVVRRPVPAKRTRAASKKA